MFIFRWLSLILIVVALMLLGADIVSTLERNGVAVVRSFAQILLLFGVDAIGWLRNGLPGRAAAIGLSVMSGPAWLVVGVPGAVLAALTSRPRKNPRLPRSQPPIER
jgi:hypothetical protein